METYSILLNPQQIATLKRDYAAHIVTKKLPYVAFQIKTSDTTITVYESGKVVFQGEGAQFHATPYLAKGQKGSTKPETSKAKSAPVAFKPSAGSDEVGTGDYFGPVVVCACFVDEKAYQQLPIAQITDSKQINDETILELGPLLQKTLTHSLLILDNPTYNRVHETNNMNAIKAKLHNQAYLHLREKVQLSDLNIIDQFTSPSSYYRYLKDEPEIFKPLHFETKAEAKYLAVACASIIARFTFLESMRQLSTTYDFEFPKGAGSHVDIKAQDFLKRYPETELNNVAKLHFVNTKRILKL